MLSQCTWRVSAIMAMGACLFAFWLSDSPVDGREKGKDAAVLKGKIGAIDTDNRTITLVITAYDRKKQEATETEKVLQVPKDAIIMQDDVPTKLDDVKRGCPTTVKVEKDKAVSIAVDGPTIRGQFKATNPDRNTITVIAGRDMGEKVYHLLKSTKVTNKDGKTSKVQDIQVGAEIVLTLSVAGDSTVIRIQPVVLEKNRRGD